MNPQVILSYFCLGSNDLDIMDNTNKLPKNYGPSKKELNV